MVNLIRNILVSVRLFGRGKHIKPYRDKAVSIRPAEGKHSKAFLAFMSYMVIDPCKKFHNFSAVPGNNRIIQDQNFDPLWPGQSTESGSYLSSEKQKKLLPVERGFIQETIVSIL